MPRDRRRTRRLRKEEIQHHHLLLRVETRTCPSAADKAEAHALIENIVRDINMELLGAPHIYYVTEPHYNEGLTAIAPIKTSHIAFHFWSNPEHRILKNRDSRCLLQMDIYTCGSLSIADIQQIFHHLTHYEPTHVNATLLNRRWSMTLDRQLVWDKHANRLPWTRWADSLTRL